MEANKIILATFAKMIQTSNNQIQGGKKSLVPLTSEASNDTIYIPKKEEFQAIKWKNYRM